MAIDRVGVFYSRGRNFGDILQSIRKALPDAEITAVLPGDYVLSSQELGCVDHTHLLDLAAYSPRNPSAFLGLIHVLRERRFDRFVILFDSPRLRIVAALAGAGRTDFFTFDRRLAAIRPSIPGVLAGAAARAIVGRLVYAAIWLAVRLCPVRFRKNG